MFVVVTYDVSTETAAGRRRLRQVAKVCKDYGQRVQNSVFECLIAPDKWLIFKDKLTNIYDQDEDSLRFYFLGSNWQHKVEHLGAKPGLNPEGTIIL